MEPSEGPMASMSPLAGRRILLAAEYIDHGGTRTYFTDLVNFYTRHGAEVVAVTTHEEPDDQMAALFDSLGQELLTYSQALARFTDQRFEPPTAWGMRKFQREKQMFQLLAEHFEIDQVVLSVGTSGLFLSATHARPAPVLIAHGYPHGMRQRLLGRWFHGRQLPRDLTIVTVSDFSAQLFHRAWGLPRAGIETLTIYSTCGAGLSIDDAVASENLVLTAALLDPHKKPMDWIATAQRVTANLREGSRPSFVWIGDGPALVGARRTARHCDACISFPGWVDDVSPYYQRSRVYLQMSSIESLGLSVIDALRHGLPSVVSDAGGLPEVVEHGISGFVFPAGDIAAAAAYVTLLLEDQALWDRQSAAARLRYEERFSFSNWTEGLFRAHNRGINEDQTAM